MPAGGVVSRGAGLLFLFFPVSTDAPVYHFPWSTIGLITVNTVVFVLTNGFISIPAALPLFPDGEIGGPIAEWFCLWLGDGFRPVGWLTSHFLHAGFMHYFFNMLFLWTFGLIVEGKLGPARFLGFCLAAGLMQDMMLQLAFFWIAEPSPCLGASGLVYSLMAASILWAPKNDISMFYFFWFAFVVRAGVAELSVIATSWLLLGYSLFFIMIEWLLARATGLPLNGNLWSFILHAAGAIAGAAIAYWLLKSKKVDCENWDLLAVMAGRHGYQPGSGGTLGSSRYTDVDAKLGPDRKTRKKIAKRRKEREAREAAPPEDPIDPRERIAELLNAGKVRPALAALNDRRRVAPSFRLEDMDTLRLAQGLDKLGDIEDSLGVFREYLERQPDAPKVRLYVARLLLMKCERPKAALSVLDTVDLQDLGKKERAVMAAVREKAEAMIEEGVLELRGEDW